jgi:flavodoxin
MEALVIYDTTFGNTQLVAHAVGAALGERYWVHVVPVAEAGEIPPQIDLLVAGGPTHRHRASQAMREFLDAIPRGAVRGVPAAAFDTRYRGARWLTGSAAVALARVLKRKGARLVVPPESFFVHRDVPPAGQKRRHELERLEPGERERAAEWAEHLAATCARQVVRAA